MLRGVWFGVMFAVVGAAHAAEPLGVGPLKLGMNYADVRAALPAAKWEETSEGHIMAPAALVFGGEAFDVTYDISPWDRITLTLVRSESLSAAECLKRYKAVGAAAEVAFGPLTALEKISADAMLRSGKQSTLSFGQKSEAWLLHNDDGLAQNQWQFDAEAQAKHGTTTVYVRGWMGRAVSLAMPEGGLTCTTTILLVALPPRPPKGEVAFDDLVVTRPITIGLKHHSLDRVPLPPAGGIAFAWNCEISESFAAPDEQPLVSCKPLNDPDVRSAYYDVAQARLRALRVGRRSKGDRWTTGERTRVKVRVAPEDRVAPPAAFPADSSSLLKFDASPRTSPRDYPMRAQRAGVEGEVLIDCIVQTDLSVICHNVTANLTPQSAEAEFVSVLDAVSRMIVRYRAHPKLANGKSSIGAGFHARIRLKLD